MGAVRSGNAAASATLSSSGRGWAITCFARSSGMPERFKALWTSIRRSALACVSLRRLPLECAPAQLRAQRQQHGAACWVAPQLYWKDAKLQCLGKLSFRGPQAAAVYTRGVKMSSFRQAALQRRGFKQAPTPLAPSFASRRPRRASTGLTSGTLSRERASRRQCRKHESWQLQRRTGWASKLSIVKILPVGASYAFGPRRRP